MPTYSLEICDYLLHVSDFKNIAVGAKTGAGGSIAWPLCTSFSVKASRLTQVPVYS
jgi:hypothetical protein